MELLPRLSRNLLHCCEKVISTPGIGFSNFDTDYLVFSNTSTTKRFFAAHLAESSPRGDLTLGPLFEVLYRMLQLTKGQRGLSAQA